MSFQHRNVPPEMVAAQHLLVERLHLALETLSPVLRPDVIRAFEGEGKLFSSPSHHQDENRPPLVAGVWPLLVYFVASTISPTCNQYCVCSAALAVECMALSIDLDDDVMDDDQTRTLEVLGVARAITVSRTLSLLAVQLLLSLEAGGISSFTLHRLVDTLLTSTAVVMAGQHRDLVAEQQDIASMTYEQCIEIAQAKAGALMRLACMMGAIAADATSEQCEQFARMGELLGISHQLDNDSHDFEHLVRPHNTTQMEAVTIKTDILRGKKTLPVFFAAEMGVTLPQSKEDVDSLSKEQVRMLHAASVETWGICLVYRERVQSCLQEIARHHTPSEALLFLLEI